VRYRRLGESAWSQGGSLNCSLSGVLFKSEQRFDVDTLIEMAFALPLEIAANQRAIVFCRGKIIRTVMPVINDGQPRVAARILEYIPVSEWKPQRPQTTGGGGKRGFTRRNQEFDPAKLLPALFPRMSLDLQIPAQFLSYCLSV
jgi:hypothetical protein